MSVKNVFFILFLIALTTQSGFAEQKVIDPTTITGVAVNGDVDTANPGTTCITISSPTSATCPAGVIGIPNNNAKLLTAALTAKATGSSVWLYYVDSAPNLHCPGLVFTPCSLISIFIQ